MLRLRLSSATNGGNLQSDPRTVVSGNRVVDETLGATVPLIGGVAWRTGVQVGFAAHVSINGWVYRPRTWESRRVYKVGYGGV
jgi:hypothetical protein